MSSKRHKLVGQLLDTIPLTKHMRKDEEVLVSSIVSYSDNRKRFDWVIKDLKLVIEVMGEQHYDPISFGNRGDAKEQFGKQVRYDLDKQNAAIAGGYQYLEIPYWIKLDENWLSTAILEKINELDSIQQTESTTQFQVPSIKTSDRHTQLYKQLQKRNNLQSKGFPKKDLSTTSWRQGLRIVKDKPNDEENST